MYRTKTYIAGDWTGDEETIRQLYTWNESNYWGLSFHDAHELTQARDSSLKCSIKRSLKTRLDVSKTFVLVVGKDTKDLRAGSCAYCPSYNSWSQYCARGSNVDYRSYIEYECEEAVNANMKIVVLYNYSNVDKEKCPEILKYRGVHLQMYYYEAGQAYWNYNAIKKAIMD